jgi:hypothetical protein
MSPTTNEEWHATACILCECNCGIVVQLEDRTIAKIRGDKEHPASQGYTCNKALRLDHYQNNRNRLTSPLRRRDDGSYEVVKPGATRASAVTRTQAEGIDRAREILRNDGGGELAVRGNNGKIRAQDTIAPGNDPESSRG